MTKKKVIPQIEVPFQESPLEIIPALNNEIKIACKSAGLSLLKSLEVIKDAQSATRLMVDKFGGEHEEPDHDKRLRGAIMHLELEGYIKNGKSPTIDNSKHTHVTVMWKDNKTSRILDGGI